MTISEINKATVEQAFSTGRLEDYKWPDDAHNVTRMPDPAREHLIKVMAESEEAERRVRNALHNERTNPLKVEQVFRKQKKLIVDAWTLENDITRLPFFPEFLAICRIFPHFEKELPFDAFDHKNCDQ